MLIVTSIIAPQLTAISEVSTIYRNQIGLQVRKVIK
jgi:hypothetical protein